MQKHISTKSNDFSKKEKVSESSSNFLSKSLNIFSGGRGGSIMALSHNRNNDFYGKNSYFQYFWQTFFMTYSCKNKFLIQNE